MNMNNQGFLSNNHGGILDKRTNSYGVGILNRNNNNGPVKIQSNEYLRKPMTPDTTTIANHNK